MAPSVKQIQRLLALVFLLLGALCVLAPSFCESIFVRAEYRHQSSLTHLLFGCFGAQAVLAGTLLMVGEFDAHGILTFGLVGSIPFFVFDVYFVFLRRVLTYAALLDAVGNAVIVLCTVTMYKMKKNEVSLGSTATATASASVKYEAIS